jgi:hypothetical protein
MADETVKKLLIKLGISTADWKVAINEIKSQLNSVNAQAKKDAAQMKASQKEQIDLTRQQIMDQKKMVAEAKVLQEVDRAKTVWQKQQAEHIKTAIQQRILETAEAKKQAVIQQAAIKMTQEQLRLEQQRFKIYQQQLALQQKQSKQQTSAGGGGGMLGGLAGMLGGGPIGMIAAGASIGNVVSETATKLMDHAIESMHRLGDAILEATGPAAQLREQFEKLTKRAGVAPDEYLTKLRVATRGLADDTALYRIANNFMQQGLKVSTDDVAKLVGVTVALARAQGKDAVEATNALERASKTGRTQQLAMVTGLTRQALQLRGVSQAMDITSRNTLQFNQTLAAMEARLKSIGTPATTLPELFKQWSNVQKNLTDDIAIAITKSQGYKEAVSGLSKLLFSLDPILKNVVKGVEKLTDVFELITPTVKLVVDSFKLFFAVQDSIGKVLSNVTGLGKELNSLPGKAGPFRQFIAEMSMGFLTLAEYVNETAIRISAVGDIVDAVLSRKFAAARAAYKGMKADLDNSRQDYLGSMMGAAKFGLGIDDETKAAGPQHDIDPNIQKAKMIQKLNLEIIKEENKLALELTMERLKSEEMLVKRAYEQSIIDLQAKVAREKEIYTQEHGAKLIQIEADRQAEVGNIRTAGRESGLPKDVIERQIKLANEKARVQTVSENTSFNQKFGGAEDQAIKDKQDAYRKYVSEQTKLAEAGVQQRLLILEKEFKQGIVGADSYLIDKRDLINQEFIATRDGLGKQLEAAVGNAKEQETINAEILQAKIKAEKELTALMMSEDDIRLQSLQTQYKLQIAPLETQVKLAQGDITGQSAGAVTSGQQQLLEAAKDHLKDLQRETFDPMSDAWLRQQEDIEQTKLKVQELGLELLKLHNISVPLGGIFGGVSAGAGAIPRSRTAAGVSELFGNMQGVSADIGRFTEMNQAFKDKAAANKEKGLPAGPTNIVTGLEQSFKGLFDSTKPLSDRFKDFGTTLEGVISGIQGMIKGVTGGKSTAGGAVSGGMAGVQFGANFGPVGAVVGGAAGAVMGGIFGGKEAQLTRDLHKIQTQMESIIADLRSGTISMSQAIQDLRSERKQAIAMLAQDPKGGKGGGKGGKKGYTPSQAQAAIQAIDTQIQQLVDQQATVLQNLTTSLMELANPVQFQDYLQSLDSIIQKYQQFASAAQGNAQMVGEANQYLNDSINQYVTTLSQQLNQAQQQAIQDALTLINLEYQRQQIINQEAQQEYDVLTQGVMVRQRTTAMTKGQEIGQLRYQRDMQLQQINEQISLQKFKVQTETQIFNLANTRIGLENQLLAAQESAATYQMNQVIALSQVVGALQSGLTGGQLMQTITTMMAGGAMPTESGIMLALLQMLGLAGNVPPGVTTGQYGVKNWLSGIPSTDASAAQFVAAQQPNFPNLILGGNYGLAAEEAKQYVSQGTVEGYDMQGLVSWLQQQGTGGTGTGGGGTGTGTGGTGTGTGQGGGIGGGTGPRPGPGTKGGVLYYPGAAAGGDVTGPVAVGEKGPEILAPGTKGTVIPNPIISALNAMVGKGLGSPVDNHQLSVHKQLYDITSARTSMEMTVISARSSQLQLETAHLQALQDTLASITAGGQTGLEDMLQKVYEVRGRYGSANFRRETL